MQEQNNFKYIYKSKELSLEELKEITINNTSLGLCIVDILGITLCDNKDYIYKLIEEKISAKKELVDKEQKLKIAEDSKKEALKQLNITLKNTITQPSQSYHTSPENTEVKVKAYKETEGKADYSEINLEILDLIAERFTANKHKYPQGNMKKPIDIKSLEWALFRHVKKMVQPIVTDKETYKDHLAAVLCNASMILDQLSYNQPNVP